MSPSSSECLGLSPSSAFNFLLSMYPIRLPLLPTWGNCNQVLDTSFSLSQLLEVCEDKTTSSQIQNKQMKTLGKCVCAEVVVEKNKIRKNY